MTLWQSRFNPLGCALTVPGGGEAVGEGREGGGGLNFAVKSEIL